MTTKKGTNSPRNARDAEISRFFGSKGTVRNTNTFKSGYGHKFDNPRSTKKIINDLKGAPTYQSSVFSHYNEPSDTIKKSSGLDFEPQYKNMPDAYTSKQIFFSDAVPSQSKKYQRVKKLLDNGITSQGEAKDIKKKFLQGHFGGEGAYDINEKISIKEDDNVLTVKDENCRRTEEVIMPSSVCLNDYQYYSKLNPDYNSKNGLQNSLSSQIPLHQNTYSKNEWERKPNIENDFQDDNDRKNRQADHNYSNIFNNQGSLGPRTNAALNKCKSENRIATHEFLGSTAEIVKPNTSNGNMFLSSRENTLWNVLQGERPKDYKLTTSYRDNTKNTRESFTSVRQLKNEAVIKNNLDTVNGLAGQGSFNLYKKPVKCHESNIVKLNVLDAQNLDPIALRQEIARKGYQVMDVNKHLDNITGASNGLAEIRLKLPNDKTLNEVQKAVSEIGLNLERQKNAAVVDRNFSNVWMHNGCSIVQGTTDHGYRQGFVQSDARHKRVIEMRSNGDLFGMSK